jgi:serine/threonine-protein kinase
VGRYRLARLIGRGAYGEVYVGAAEDGPNVAVKVLDPSLAREAEVIARFEREAETARRLDHPNVVRVLDVGSARGKHYIVMELVHGGSLRRLLQRGAPPAVLLSILAEVARGLAFAHAAGVVHRDVKPENVLVTRSRHAKIADFGLARAADLATLTTDGRMLGTASYMSPEQARGRRAVPASDVYSVGVMLYEIISGARPFSSDTPHGFIYQHAEQEPARPRVLPAFPADLAALTLRCLAKDPEQRPPMDEVAALLEEASRRIVTARRPRLRRIVLAVAAAIVLLSAAVVSFPAILDPLCGDWPGSTAFRSLRSAARSAHDAIF